MHYKVSVNLLQNLCWGPRKLQTWPFESRRASSSCPSLQAGSRGKRTGGFRGTAAPLPSSASGMQGRGAGEVPGSGCWKDSSPRLCASWSKLAGVLKLTRNIMDTLLILRETLWDYFKHIILQDQGPTWPSRGQFLDLAAAPMLT